MVNQTINIDYKQAERILKNAADVVRKKTILKIITIASSPMYKDIKSKIPKADRVIIRKSAGVGRAIYEIGNLQKSFKRFKGKGENPILYLGFHVGFKASNDGFYGFWIEKGKKGQRGKFMLLSGKQRGEGKTIKRFDDFFVKKIQQEIKKGRL